jgi:hypothetical protein
VTEAFAHLLWVLLNPDPMFIPPQLCTRVSGRAWLGISVLPFRQFLDALWDGAFGG